jgi:hypothetical protein
MPLVSSAFPPSLTKPLMSEFNSAQPTGQSTADFGFASSFEFVALMDSLHLERPSVPSMFPSQYFPNTNFSTFDPTPNTFFGPSSDFNALIPCQCR